MRIKNCLNVGKRMARNGRDFGHGAAGFRQASDGRTAEIMERQSNDACSRAETLGLTVPPNLLALADEVIE
jgi:hypothetical protein